MQSMDRISSFIKSYIKDDEGILGEIYNRAVEMKVPVMRPETKEVLKTQLIIKKPKSILEIGTAHGYSALFMSRYIDDDATITTLELDEERIKIAAQNIRLMEKENVINVIAGDAAKTLKEIPDNSFDFAFVDAAKAQYINYLPDVKRVVSDGGVIVSDNILQDGEVLESHFTVDKRNRTIHDRMREYIEAISFDERLDTAILSVADGMAISINHK